MGSPEGRVGPETAVPGGDSCFTANLGGRVLSRERSLGPCLHKGHRRAALAYWLEGGLPNNTPARAEGTTCLPCCPSKGVASRLPSLSEAAAALTRAAGEA